MLHSLKFVIYCDWWQILNDWLLQTPLMSVLCLTVCLHDFGKKAPSNIAVTWGVCGLIVLNVKFSPSSTGSTQTDIFGLFATRLHTIRISNSCKSEPEANRHLRSSGTTTCVIPWSRTRLGDRSFDVVRPRPWNKLPTSLQSSDSLF